VEDERGDFGWAAPDDEVLAFVNDLERPIGTYLYGGRMYETMAVWDTMQPDPDRQPLMVDLPGSGGQPTRSCSPGRWTGHPAHGPVSSRRSTPARSRR
jgi:hypothetical protein